MINYNKHLVFIAFFVGVFGVPSMCLPVEADSRGDWWLDPRLDGASKMTAGAAAVGDIAQIIYEFAARRAIKKKSRCAWGR